MGYEGSISYPGIVTPIYIRAAVRTNGFRADTCLLISEPTTQASPPALTGTLSFGFDSTTINWPNALCDSLLMTVTDGGQSLLWTIKDGRWRHWKRFITGAYNVRLPDGTIDTDTEKTLAELVTLLATAMGTTIDVSAITSTEKPEVVWDHDRAVLEIETLLYARGYVASYQFDDSYKVYRVGVGATLPNDGDVVNFANSLNPPELPLTLRALGAQTRVQSKLKCVPVGEDTDGRVREVNDLSYKPSGGWPPELKDFSYITDPIARDLAKKSVGKWYQAKFQANGSFDIKDGTDYCPGEITVTSALQYLPLSDKLVSAAVDIHGKKRLDDAYVEGVFYDQSGNPAKNANTPEFSRLSGQFWKLDRELGIVMFTDIQVKTIAGHTATTPAFGFAEVYLTCSYAVHDNTSHIKDRFIWDRSLGGTGMDQVNAEEIERTLVCEYDTDHVTIVTITDNQSTLEAYADTLLDNVAASYSTGLGNAIQYRGIRQYTTDGINWQVVWRVAVPAGNGKPHFSTFVAQNMECHPLVPTAARRRQSRQAERANQWNTTRGRRYRNSKKGGAH